MLLSEPHVFRALNTCSDELYSELVSYIMERIAHQRILNYERLQIPSTSGVAPDDAHVLTESKYNLKKDCRLKARRQPF